LGQISAWLIGDSDPPVPTPPADGKRAPKPLVGERPAPENPIIDSASDESAFVLMSHLYAEQFDSLKKCGRFLDKHPEIRQKKPAANRRLVHAGDWKRFWAEKEKQRWDALGESALDDAISRTNANNLKTASRKCK